MYYVPYYPYYPCFFLPAIPTSPFNFISTLAIIFVSLGKRISQHYRDHIIAIANHESWRWQVFAHNSNIIILYI